MNRDSCSTLTPAYVNGMTNLRRSFPVSDDDDEPTSVFVRGELTPGDLRAARGARGRQAVDPRLMRPSHAPPEETLVHGRPAKENTAFTSTGPQDAVEAEVEAEVEPRTYSLPRDLEAMSERWQRARLPVVCVISAAIGLLAWSLEESASHPSSTKTAVHHLETSAH